jgi:hypothetical protein
MSVFAAAGHAELGAVGDVVMALFRMQLPADRVELCAVTGLTSTTRVAFETLLQLSVAVGMLLLLGAASVVQLARARRRRALPPPGNAPRTAAGGIPPPPPTPRPAHAQASAGGGSGASSGAGSPIGGSRSGRGPEWAQADWRAAPGVAACGGGHCFGCRCALCVQVKPVRRTYVSPARGFAYDVTLVDGDSEARGPRGYSPDACVDAAGTAVGRADTSVGAVGDSNPATLGGDGARPPLSPGPGVGVIGDAAPVAVMAPRARLVTAAANFFLTAYATITVACVKMLHCVRVPGTSAASRWLFIRGTVRCNYGGWQLPYVAVAPLCWK